MVPICNKKKQICVNISDLSTLKDFQKFGVLGLKSKERERECYQSGPAGGGISNPVNPLIH
jgi:hypothetical protein